MARSKSYAPPSPRGSAPKTPPGFIIDRDRDQPCPPVPSDHPHSSLLKPPFPSIMKCQVFITGAWKFETEKEFPVVFR
jgi:hypothetical protein